MRGNPIKQTFAFISGFGAGISATFGLTWWGTSSTLAEYSTKIQPYLNTTMMVYNASVKFAETLAGDSGGMKAGVAVGAVVMLMFATIACAFPTPNDTKTERDSNPQTDGGELSANEPENHSFKPTSM